MFIPAYLMPIVWALMISGVLFSVWIVRLVMDLRAIRSL